MLDHKKFNTNSKQKQKEIAERFGPLLLGDKFPVDEKGEPLKSLNSVQTPDVLDKMVVKFLSDLEAQLNQEKLEKQQREAVKTSELF